MWLHKSGIPAKERSGGERKEISRTRRSRTTRRERKKVIIKRTTKKPKDKRRSVLEEKDPRGKSLEGGKRQKKKWKNRRPRSMESVNLHYAPPSAVPEKG